MGITITIYMVDLNYLYMVSAEKNIIHLSDLPSLSYTILQLLIFHNIIIILPLMKLKTNIFHHLLLHLQWLSFLAWSAIITFNSIRLLLLWCLRICCYIYIYDLLAILWSGYDSFCSIYYYLLSSQVWL